MTIATIETKEDLKLVIIHHLQKGATNAIKKAKLARMLGVNERQMRLAIVELRHTGTPILSCQLGYYLAEDITEIQEARKYLRSYIISLCIDLRDLKNLEHNYTGQIGMKF